HCALPPQVTHVWPVGRGSAPWEIARRSPDLPRRARTGPCPTLSGYDLARRTLPGCATATRAAGYFRNRTAAIAQLRKAPELAMLRSCEDFEKLVKELEE